MKPALVFMFPGQGAQYFEMGKELYASHPRFRLWMNHCDHIARPLINKSLIDIIYHGNKSDPFDRLLYSNPSLFSIEFSLARILLEAGLKPSLLLGYSLGEFACAVIAGTMSVEQAMKLVIDFAEIMENSAEPAQMLAVLAPVDVLDKVPIEDCWVACRNFNNHFVVSGLPRGVAALQTRLTQQGVVSQLLPVRFAFHTPLVEQQQVALRAIAEGVNYSPMSIPIASSSLTAMASLQTTAPELPTDYFWHVLRQPVEFQQTVTHLLDTNEYHFIDVGPSGTLATFVKYLIPPGANSKAWEVMNAFGRDLQSLEKLLANLTTSVPVTT